MKLKWTVQQKPTGRYRSFHRHGWPTASYKTLGEEYAGHIAAVDGSAYTSRDAELATLEVWVACRDKNPVQFTNKRLVKRFLGLTAAKKALSDYLQAHPEHWPIGTRP